MKKILIPLFAAIMLAGSGLFAANRYFEDGYWHDAPSTEWELATKKRADLMLKIRWTPISPMPQTASRNRMDAMFASDKEYKGAPYSSVSQFDGFIGRNVTFHTFLSALSNPRSYIYEVNYHNAPWNLSSGPYYGSVCSSTVCYCWGLVSNFITNAIFHGNTRYIEDIGTDLSAIQLYDGICWYNEQTRKGHMMMFYDIARDSDGNICRLGIFESTKPKVRVKYYSLEEFLQLVEKRGAKYFRLRKDLLPKLETAPFMEQELKRDDTLPSALCLKTGDCKTFALSDTVRIDILSGGFKQLCLFRDGEAFSERKIRKGDEIELAGLPEGLYEARLKKGDKLSVPTRFQICNPGCKVSRNGKNIEVIPEDSNLTPLFITYQKGYRYSPIIFNRGDGSGVWVAEDVYDCKYYFTITFAGKYGTVRSRKISSL